MGVVEREVNRCRGIASSKPAAAHAERSRRGPGPGQGTYLQCKPAGFSDPAIFPYRQSFARRFNLTARIASICHAIRLFPSVLNTSTATIACPAALFAAIVPAVTAPI
jgi:hypothetical protein